jgi:nucleotide-binding universal stress UspA family protein
MTTKPIVVGYDGSDSSGLALNWALQAARSRKTSVRIVNVVIPPLNPVPSHLGYIEADPAELRNAADQTLAAAVAAARSEASQVEVETRLVEGTAAAVLIDQSSDAELAVVGSRGLGGFSELLLGSTSFELATHAHCPVVVIRTDSSTGEPGPDSGRVVVGVDGSALSTDALGFAFAEASLRGRGLTATHAWQAPFYDVPGKGVPLPENVAATQFGGEEMQTLADALVGWKQKFPTVDVREVVVRANPATALVAASVGAELLVVGSRGRGGFRSLLLGSVGHAVLHHAHCPVAIVRPNDA